MIALLKRALELKPSRRFEDCGQMLAAYLRAKPKVLRHYDRVAAPEEGQADDEARLEGDPAAAVSTAIWPTVGNDAEVRQVRRAGFGIHARLPLVRRRQEGAARGDVVSAALPALQSRHETRLAILPVVLWARIRGCFGAAIHGPPLRGPMSQSEVRSQGPDAVHALLPLVPHQSAAGMEDSRAARTRAANVAGACCANSGCTARGARRGLHSRPILGRVCGG